jgi:uncharacterized protein (TIGR03437 family)
MSVWIESTWQDPNGRLYAWYHREPSAGCANPNLRLPEIGALRSDDNGASFTDLGVILQAPTAVNCSAGNGFFAGGNGDFSVLTDSVGGYFYFLFTNYGGPVDQQGVGIARMAFRDRDAPAGKVWKYRAGQWLEPGLGGQLSPVFPAAADWGRSDTDSFWGPSLHYNSYLNAYVVLMNRSCCSPGFPQEGIYVAFNSDIGNPAGWSAPVRIWTGSKQGYDPPEWYPQVLGTGPGETDKLAGQVARFFLAGDSTYEIVFTRAVAPLAITTTSPLPSGVAGAAYSTTLAANGGVPPYHWSVSSGALPGGLALDAASGRISGTLSAAGTFAFTVQVADNGGGSASQAFTIVVTSGVSITTTGPLPSGVAGAAYSTTLAASGGVPPYHWSLTSGALPGGLALDGASGRIGGTLSAAGTFAFTVQVADSGGGGAAQAFTIVVTSGVSITTTGPLPSGVAGAAYSTMLAASGGVPPYHWSVSSGALPGGLALDAASGRIGGTPNAAGTFAFTVQVADSGGGGAAQAFTIVVTSGVSITTTGPLPSGVAGTAYSTTLAASGGVPPYHWSLASGALPGGLALDAASGRIAGTLSAAGTFAFTVQVADSGGGGAAQAFTIAVAPAPQPVTITTPATLPGGTSGAVYLLTLSAAGGVPPYTWSLISGALPPGVQWNASGVLSGTPSASGSYSFTLQVTDSAASPARQTFSLSIAAAPVLADTPLLSAASYGPAIASGSIVSIFGTEMAAGAQSANAVPLPVDMSGTNVTINGITAPLFYTSPTQINAQVPFEILPGQATVVVHRGGQASAARSAGISAAAPAIFTVNQTGAGPGVIVHASDFSLVTASSPAHAGEYVILYCTGLGALQRPVRTGDVPPTPPPQIAGQAQVTFGSVPAVVSYAGVAPGFVGLYQVNAQIAAGTPAGAAVPVQIFINGAPSNPVTLAVQ